MIPPISLRVWILHSYIEKLNNFTFATKKKTCRSLLLRRNTMRTQPSGKVYKENPPVGLGSWKGRPTMKEFDQVSSGSQQWVVAFAFSLVNWFLHITTGSHKPQNKHLDGKQHWTPASFNKLFNTEFFRYWFQVFELKRKKFTAQHSCCLINIGKTVLYLKVIFL